MGPFRTPPSRAAAPRRRALLAAAAAAITATVAIPASAAADWKCAATAVSGTVLGQSMQPVSVTDCENRLQSLSTSGAFAFTAGGAAATTSEGSGVAREVAAVGGLSNLRVQSLPNLSGVTLPALPSFSEYAAVELPALQLPIGLLGINVSSVVTVDLRDALTALATPANVLPTTDLVTAAGALARASGRCVNGRAVLDSATDLTNLRVLGQAVPLDQAVEQTLNLASSIDGKNVNRDLVKVVDATNNLLGLSLDQIAALPTVQAAITDLIASLPTIALPALPAEVKVTPGSQTRTATSVLQNGPRVEVTLLGTKLADLVLGTAALDATGVNCRVAGAQSSPGTPVNPAEALLQCTERKVILEDVQQRGNRVRLIGVASPEHAGKSVVLRLTTTGRQVARATVRRNGTFAATASLPPRSWIGTNKARYQASIGRDRSLSLKLTRRMVVSGMQARGRTVTIAGRVVGPLARPAAVIEIRRRVSCKRMEVVRRVRPNRDGTFRVTVPAPSGESAAVFRLTTRVRNNPRNARTFQTFTLPRAVALRR